MILGDQIDSLKLISHRFFFFDCPLFLGSDQDQWDRLNKQGQFYEKLSKTQNDQNEDGEKNLIDFLVRY